jgi:hypothetical protein
MYTTYFGLARLRRRGTGLIVESAGCEMAAAGVLSETLILSGVAVLSVALSLGGLSTLSFLSLVSAG